ncbi:L-rhamnose/proton symporter RhaT [Saccharicrinis aurantiacus]|uniref:L-rhamnose/proton symporter RhaT n=1 Tax=Saccharicrinis aurantiacus TaxID=1849719 RepID=UPI002493147A|nr:L-rhamnose/proton symporter RhaT [Saccharicrinis aurantiacus]
MNSLSAIGLIAIGSVGAASFYVPFKKVKEWAWESYWITQGVAAWILAPVVFALLTVPSGTLFDIIGEAPSSAKWLSLLFGALWGVGGLTFGLSIRYLGIALGQSIALGFCAAFGTLIPPIVAGENLLGSQVGVLMIIGVSICIAGIAIIGYAGALKNNGLSDEERKAAVKDFALKKGLIIAFVAGLMSAAMSYGFAAGKPIEDVALKYGTNVLFQSNPTLIFILFGGFITNLVYCVYLNIKNKTYTDYTKVSTKVLISNVGYTFLAGVLWFLQFHFYGMGKSQLSSDIAPFAWSILMALNIAFGNLWGVFLGEWKGVSKKTMAILVIGILVLILSTFVVNIG